ncbi:MAG: glycosyltransferase [Sphingobacteriales bacterium]|uniref:glycosyltransferase n=1 Tax=Hydrotalea flava TaxID=714549 RepID=UPI0008328230|nr:glycosyltransferase [Hydrotalea flava]RTL49091.1 MAG: glycosyltransferase [Sphingobacteriales bacterium]
MVKRRKIGLLYQYNENWIGGTYYIQNLVIALNRLAREEKPFLVIICQDRTTFYSFKKITGYPFLEWRAMVGKPYLFTRFMNKVSGILFKKIFFQTVRINTFNDIDILFPAIEHSAFSNVKHKLFWLPDLQEHFYPNFFTSFEINERISQQKKLISNNDIILFSSYTALHHFNTIYPQNLNQKFVLPFAVNIPKILSDNNQEVLHQYKVGEPFFICSNQFWQHKNHLVIFEAIHILKAKGIGIHVVFTGNENDYRDKTYFQKLQCRSKELGINDQVQFLGFIHRNDQITLLKKALAIIQPSLFEGWSTIVEDAKALNAWIICSDIAVHQEQLNAYPNCAFFSAEDAEQLSTQLVSFLGKKPITPYDYSTEQNKHTLQLKALFHSISNE